MCRSHWQLSCLNTFILVICEKRQFLRQHRPVSKTPSDSLYLASDHWLKHDDCCKSWWQWRPKMKWRGRRQAMWENYYKAGNRWLVLRRAIDRRTGTFSKGVKIKNQVLSRNMIRWFSFFHPLKSCCLLDRWSLPLLWHLSDVSAICNFWPQLQILGEGQLTPVNWPSRALTIANIHVFVSLDILCSRCFRTR